MKQIIKGLVLTALLISVSEAFEHIKTIEQFERVTKSGKFIVDFYAPWCEPCREMDKNLKKMNYTSKNIKVYKINIDESKELLSKYGTPQIPALLYIKDGKVLQGYIGLKGMNELKSDVKKYFSSIQ
jgi:thioredoxin 1